MIYGWIIGGLAALDLGVKSVVEGQEDDTHGQCTVFARLAFS